MLFKKQTPTEKELKIIEKAEEKLHKKACERTEATWKKELEKKIPANVYDGLKNAFTKAFSLIFEKGTGIIEKTYNKDSIQKEHMVLDYDIKMRGRRKEMQKLQKTAKRSNLKNAAITTVEGIGLGALGIGLPDIVLFVGMMMKGIYESAAHYGIDYEKSSEKVLILKMMSASMATGEMWEVQNEELNQLFSRETLEFTEEELKKQIEQTAEVFAMDMLVMKFVQGLPIVGIVGGMTNPIYYNRVLDYVQLKYRKRYIMSLREK